MNKIRIQQPYRPVNPTTAALVTSVDSNGEPNIITLGEVYNLSTKNPVVAGLGIQPSKYSYQLIKSCGEFTINLPSADLVEKVDRCGTTTGRKVKKFSAFGLTPLPASVVKPPLIMECPVNIECRLGQIYTMGDHDLLVGEVVALHVDEPAVDANGTILVERLNLLVYAFREYHAMGPLVGRHGYTAKK